MIRTLQILFTAALLLLPSAVLAGPITHYNVDWQTLPNGPVQLVNATVVEAPPGTVTLSGGAKNNGSQTYQDVKFLVQFIWDSTAPLAFTDATDTWANVNDSAVISGPSGTFNMMNTDAPLSFTKPQGTATLGATDTVPYIQIGDIGVGNTNNFSLVMVQTPRFPVFNLVGSFVSTTPIPEPSSIVLLALGSVGLALAARRRLAR